MSNGLRPQIRLLLVFLLLTGSMSSALAREIFCWHNSEGVRECGQNVPPEYSQQRIEVLNQRGMVIRVREAAKTPEQLEQEAREAAASAEQEKQEAEQRRLDRILMSTYTSERDLSLAHQSRVNAVEGLISITEGNLRSLQQNLDNMQKRAADIERGGQQLPPALLEDIDNIKRQIANNEKFVADKQQELFKLNQKYEADLARFRQLRQ